MKDKVAPPSVQVKIPAINLRLEDLAYLRSMDNQDGIRCELAERHKSRLRVLRLIETRNVPPSEEDRRKIGLELDANKVKAKIAIDNGKWRDVIHLMYSIERGLDRLEPRPRDVLTDQGRQLLAKGSITVKMKKVGCV